MNVRAVIGTLIVACILGALLRRIWSTHSVPRRLERAREQLFVEPARSLEIATYCLDDAPGSVTALQIATRAATRLRDADQALAFHEQLRSFSNSRQDISAKLAEMLIEVGRWREAEGVLKGILFESPQHEGALRQLATLLLTEGRRWESREVLIRIVRNRSYLLDELVMLGSLDELLEDNAGLQRAIDADPDSPGPLIGLGRLAEFAGEHQAAIDQFESAIEIDPSSKEAWASLGRTLLRAQRTEDLIRWKQRLPSAARSHPDALFVCGSLANIQGKRTDAIRDLAQAIGLNPNHREANYLLGQVLTQAGDAARAQEFTQRAASLDRIEVLMHRILLNERDAAIFREVSELMEALGRPLEAWAWWTALAAYHPRNAEFASRRAEAVLSSSETPLPLIASQTMLALRIDDFDAELTSDVSSNLPPPVSATNRSSIQFRDIAEEVGLGIPFFGGYRGEPRKLWIHQGFGGGVGVLDYDRDSYPDLYFVHGNQWPPQPIAAAGNLLYRAESSRYRDVSDFANVADRSYGQGVAVGDFDADGFEDIYVANIGQNRLLINNGDGTFEDVTAQTLAPRSDWTTSCLLTDINGDGFDDLYDVNYVEGDSPFQRECFNVENGEFRSCKPDLFEPATDRVWINQGTASVIDVTETCGIVTNVGRGLGIVAADFDENQTLDLFVSNDLTPNSFYVNAGTADGGTPILREEALLRGLACNGRGRVEACMGIGTRDVTADGLLDLFVTNFYDETNTFYRSGADGLFVDDTERTGAVAESREILSFGTQFLDADLDGNSDLVLVNGHVDDYSHIDIPWKMPPTFYRNLGDAQFVEDENDPFGHYSQTATLGRAVAVLDWNRDGREDFVVTHLDRNPALLVNKTHSHGESVSFRLVGTESNRTGVGAVLRVTTEDRTVVLHRTAGDGYYCSNDRTQVLGLGDRRSVSRVEVSWPSGLRQVLTEMESGHTYVIVEKSPQPYAVSDER